MFHQAEHQGRFSGPLAVVKDLFTLTYDHRTAVKVRSINLGSTEAAWRIDRQSNGRPVAIASFF